MEKLAICMKMEEKLKEIDIKHNPASRNISGYFSTYTTREPSDMMTENLRKTCTKQVLKKMEKVY